MTESHLHLRQAGTVNGAPRVGTVHDIAELASFYSEPPQGVRVNMIFSADGAATARAEDYGPVRLTEIQQAQRHREGRTKPPPIAVISGTGELPTRLVSNPDQPPLLVTCAESPVHDVVGDQRCGVLVAGEGSVDVVRAIALLRSHGLSRILCEGGPTLLDELVTADAVDEICVTLAPKLVAHQPVGLRRPPSQLPIPTMLRLEHALNYGDYVFLKYRG